MKCFHFVVSVGLRPRKLLRKNADRSNVSFPIRLLLADRSKIKLDLEMFVWYLTGPKQRNSRSVGQTVGRSVRTNKILSLCVCILYWNVNRLMSILCIRSRLYASKHQNERFKQIFACKTIIKRMLMNVSMKTKKKKKKKARETERKMCR